MRNTSPLIIALEDAWDILRGKYPEIPDSVVILGTGAANGKLHKLGHWAPRAWTVHDEPTGEFMLAGEALNEASPDAVYAVLVHEAAHALGTARGITNTSRGGRFHNKRYAELATELGLEVFKMDPYGMADTRYSPRPEDAPVLSAISEALILARPSPDPAEPKSKAKSPRVECGCPRAFRLAQTKIEEGPILCGVCGEDFLQVMEA